MTDTIISRPAAASPSRRLPHRRWANRAFDRIAPFILVTLLILLWQFLTAAQIVIPFLLPPPAAVIRWVIDDVTSGRFFMNAGLTLYRTFAGFILSAVVGVAIGILMTRLRFVRWFFDPVMSFGLPIPKIALLPAFMLWFGLYDTSKILMVAFSACFQVIVSTWQATQNTERELIWSARAVGASERAILWEVVLRAAAPQIITALQFTMPLCLIVVLITEMQMGGQGLGDAMLSAARYAKTAGVFAGILEIGFVGFCVIKGMEWLRRRLLPWHQETLRKDTT